jgi:transposase
MHRVPQPRRGEWCFHQGKLQMRQRILDRARNRSKRARHSRLSYSFGSEQRKR